MLVPSLLALTNAAILVCAIAPSPASVHRRQSATDNSALYSVPPGSPGFYHGNSTAAVTLDQHSLFLDGKRLMIYSGEFHPWRQPTGALLWRDTLEKMKVRSRVVPISLRKCDADLYNSGCGF